MDKKVKTILTGWKAPAEKHPNMFASQRGCIQGWAKKHEKTWTSVTKARKEFDRILGK